MPAYNTATRLPQDDDSAKIQVLAPDETTVVEAAIAAGNNRVALPAGATIVEIAAQDICRMAFGDSTVSAVVGTRRIFPAGSAIYKVPYTSGTTYATHIAVTQVGTSVGVVTVTKLI